VTTVRSALKEVERLAPIRPLERPPEYFSWGRYPRAQHDSVYKVYWTDQVEPILAAARPESCLPYGLGRSYGDACLNSGRNLIDCARLDRMLSFDRQTGRLWCEAGVSLAEILRVAVPAGWFLPVTPGTKFVTVGGAIANDVHGKNHHRAGTFGLHLARVQVCRSDAGVVECSPWENTDLFCATVGGLGLTGVILTAEIQLKSIPGDRIEAEAIPFQSLAGFQMLAEESDKEFEYTVAWIDSFSGEQLRGIFYRGNHARGFHPAGTKRSGPKIPFAAPDFLLNRYGLKLFNAAYYRWKARRSGRSTVGFDPFFYPLDSIRNWNLLYGARGFLQYQFVIPETASDALQEILGRINRDGMGSFLAVLKRFGAVRSPGMMSFPRPGLTLALDLPMRGERTLQLLERLDEMVVRAGGAIYPAKDARMSPETFAASFPAASEFRKFVDPALSSTFWRRVSRS
jgi:FAD/FMN-containing dehydrogenase